MKADADGVAIAVLAEAGNVVSAGQPVARIAADGEREVRIEIAEGRVGAIREAERITVGLWSNPGKLYAGQVREINPQANPATRTHEARITILAPDAAVQLGASATVYTGMRSDGNTFRLPATALGSIDKDQAAVWRVQTDQAGAFVVQPLAVNVVQYLDGAVVVTGTLTAKDRIVSAGVHRLLPGMAVEPIDRAAKAAF